MGKIGLNWDRPTLEKSCYIRGGCVPMNKFNATDYESVLRSFENWIVLGTSSFELLNNYWLRDVISNIFALSPNFTAVIATVIQLRIMLGHEQAFHSSFAYKQVHRKRMRLRRVTFRMTIYGISPISPVWKINHDFYDNTTFTTLTAQILVLQPRGQLGYLNSSLMLRWDRHLNAYLPTSVTSRYLPINHTWIFNC